VPCSPVAEDGYGISYMVAGEYEFFFHVSSKVSSKNTDSSRFKQNLFDALTDMKSVLELAIKTDKPSQKVPA
jgi:carnitine O-palmitoyltransferase 1